jgi:hypothetical protein
MTKRNAHDCYCGRPLPERSKVRGAYGTESGGIPKAIEPSTPEEWRGIPDQPDYEVSNHGRVRSYKGCRVADRANFVPKILGGWTDNAGYHRVTFGDRTRRYMHQLVAEAFIGPPPPGREVAHKNHIRHDNRAENLVYATRQENLSDRYRGKAEICRFGHPLSGGNLYVEGRGRRMCRICRRRRLAKRDPNNCPQCGEPLPEALKPLRHSLPDKARTP